VSASSTKAKYEISKVVLYTLVPTPFADKWYFVIPLIPLGDVYMHEPPIRTGLRHRHCAHRQKLSAALTEEQRGQTYQIAEAFCAPVQVAMAEFHDCPTGRWLGVTCVYMDLPFLLLQQTEHCAEKAGKRNRLCELILRKY
jgi:hypothetical protein